MKTSATNKRLRTILTDIRDGRLVPNPEFQRRLVWSNKHKLAFLNTVLRGLPFPEIFIASGGVNTETGEGTDLIVDGQQRTTTLYQYFTASPDLKVTGISPYSQLEEAEKTAFLEYEVVVRDLGQLDETETRDLFYRINSTAYSLNAMEINNARFDGELKQVCDRLSESDFFIQHQVFSNYDAKRMADVRWVLTLVITMMSSYFNRDTEHEQYLAVYNDEFPMKEEIVARLSATVDFVEALGLREKSRAWQKSDLLTLLVEVDRLLHSKRDLDPSTCGKRLRSFYAKVDRLASGDSTERDDAAHEYFAAARSGTNDRSSRMRRGLVISRVLTGEAWAQQAVLFDQS